MVHLARFMPSYSPHMDFCIGINLVLSKALKMEEVTFCFVAKVAQLEEKLFVAIKENESLEETLTTAQGKVSIQVVVMQIVSNFILSYKSVVSLDNEVNHFQTKHNLALRKSNGFETTMTESID